ncbi:hypothetical protein ACHHYP_04642 [Achlya hypogyna]|uniref:Uncharacterized protein n=1 Tax=Achlya hypogyna TaxID=1202772 RepID=A0A1V9ZP05_ACHHY|nr:hypothetical protein ACHHYP_04642 [Achlya hypogyna]
MEAVVRKLAHPIEEIRVRALHAVAAKVDNGLWPSPKSFPPSIQALLADALPPLAGDYPQAASLLQQLALPPSDVPPRRNVLSSSKSVVPTVDSDAVAVRDSVAPQEHTDLEHGWSFPVVTLAEADDQLLFEIEVKLKLQTCPKELLSELRRFQETALVDFPPEIFLQRPAILEYLVHLVQLPLLDPPAGFGHVYYNYVKASPSVALLLTVVDVLQYLVSAWATASRLHAHGTYCTPRTAAGLKYPQFPVKPAVGGWSYAGALHCIATRMLTALAQPHAPQAQLVAAITSLSPALLRDVSDATYDHPRFTALFHGIAAALNPALDGHLLLPLEHWLTRLLRALQPVELAADRIAVPAQLADVVEAMVYATCAGDLLPYVAALRPGTEEKWAHFVRRQALDRACDPFLDDVGALLDGSAVDVAALVVTARDLLDVLRRRDDPRRLPLLAAVAHVIGAAADTAPLAPQLRDLLVELTPLCLDTNAHYDTLRAYLPGPLGTVLAAPEVLLGLCQRLAMAPTLAALWELVDDCFVALDTQLPASVLPFLQHWAYAEMPLSPKHADLQERWARLLHRQELSALDDALLRLRCLFHRSEYIRRAAIAGLNEAFALATTDDVFGGDDFAAALRQYARAHHSPPTVGIPTASKVVEKVAMWNSMLLSTSLDAKIKAAVLKQAAERLCNVGAMDVLVDSGVVATFVATIMSALAELPPTAAAIVLVLDRILSQSAVVRQWFRSNEAWLRVLAECAGSETSLELRSSTYCCLLYITCAREVWTTEATDAVSIPSMLLGTFGLHASVWPTLHFLQTTALLSMMPPTPMDATVPPSKPQSLAWAPSQVSSAFGQLEAASSHRAYLNQLYDLRWRVQLAPDVWAPAVVAHGSALLRLLETYPCSAKDVAALAGLLRFVASVAPQLPDAAAFLTSLLVRLKVHVAPLLRQVDAAHLSLFSATLRVLVALADISRDLALFVAAFVIDTELHTSVLLAWGLAADASVAPPTQLLALRLVVRLTSLSTADVAAWQAFAVGPLRPMLIALLRVHRRGDSFQDKARALRALQCLELSPVEDATDAADTAAIARNFLFDIDARLRALSYLLLARADVDEQIAILARDTLGDATECIAVRQAAGAVVVRTPNVDATPFLHMLKADDSDVHPVLALAFLQLVPLGAPDLATLPWPTLLSLEAHLGSCRHLSMTALGLRKDLVGAFSTLAEEAWCDSHVTSATACIRKALVLLLSSSLPNPAGLLPAITSVLASAEPLQSPFTALVGDIFGFLSEMLHDTSLHLPTVFVRALLGALQRSTADRFTDAHLLALVVVPAAALLPHVLAPMLQCDPTGTTVLCDQIAALLLHLDKATVELVAALAKMLTTLCEGQGVAVPRRDRLVKEMWRRLLATADTMRLHGVSVTSARLYQLHSAVLGAAMLGSDDTLELDLPRHVASIWSALCAPPSKDNEPVAKATLALLCNYVFQNDAAKRSVATCSGLYSLLWDAALDLLGRHPTLVHTVLKAVVLHIDGVLAAMKRGYIGKALQVVDAELLKVTKGTKGVDLHAIGRLIDVLANVASIDDGRQEIGACSRLHDIFMDLLAQPALRRPTVLWIRNMACATVGKSQLAQWRGLLEALVELLDDADAVVLLHASSAIWWLLYNNQRGLALVQAQASWQTRVSEAYAKATAQVAEGRLEEEIEFQLGNIVRLLTAEPSR